VNTSGNVKNGFLTSVYNWHAPHAYGGADKDMGKGVVEVANLYSARPGTGSIIVGVLDDRVFGIIRQVAPSTFSALCRFRRA